MVENWMDTGYREILGRLRQDLTYARRAYKQGWMSRHELAEAELGVARALGQGIKIRIAYEGNYFDLSDVIQVRKANCLGYSQMFYVIGSSIGLSVHVVTVVVPGASGLKGVPSHVCNIVSLSDGTLVIVDLTREDDFTSRPFGSKESPCLQEDRLEDGDESNLQDTDPLVYRIQQKVPCPTMRILWASAEWRDSPTADTRRLQVLSNHELLGEIYFSRGTLCTASGQDEEAISHYSKAIQLSPQCDRAYNNRGAIYLLRGEYTKAMADIDQAIEITPVFAQAYQNRAGVYLALGEHPKAVSDYTLAIQLDPESARPYFGRGLAYLALGQYEEAIADYTKAIALEPRFAWAYLRRGTAYAHTAKYGKATEDLLRAVQLDPSLKTNVEQTSEQFKLNLTRG